VKYKPGDEVQFDLFAIFFKEREREALVPKKMVLDVKYIPYLFETFFLMWCIFNEIPRTHYLLLHAV